LRSSPERPRAVTRAFDGAAQAVAEQLRPLRGMPIHVNGASGFLASNLIALLHRASALGGLDLRLHASARRPIEQVNVFRFLGLEPDVQWERASAETTTLSGLTGGVAVHTASYGAPADYLRDPIATFRANTDGLIRTFAEAARVGAAHVVYVSSAEVYGQPPAEAIPTSEDFLGGPNLADVRSIYGESKRMAEALGVALARETGISFTAVRPWNLYGPGQRLSDGRVPFAFMRMALEDGSIRLLSDGTPRRSVCFVWDGLLQLAACLDPARPAGQPVNIGNPNDERSILELATLCAGEAGLDPDDVSLEPSGGAPGLLRCAPDISRVCAHARVPFPPLTPVADGLALLREWVQWSLADA
jgi:nucleoside-diphosphate-sugar epimerase